MRMLSYRALLFSAILFLALVAVDTSRAQSPSTPNRPKLITIRAQDEPLRELLMRIGAQSGLSMIVPSDARAQVSVSLDHVPVDQALSAVLKPHALTFEREGNIVIVTALGLGLKPSPSPSPSHAPIVLNLNVVTADRAAALVRRLYPRAQVAVDRAANAIIVLGAAEDLEAMRTLIQGIDIKNPTSTTVEALPLRLANPRQVASELRPLYPAARIAVGPNRSILIAASPQDIAQIKAVIGSIDTPPVTPTPTISSTEGVKINQARPQDVARAIAHQFTAVRASVAGGSVVITGSADDVSKAKALIALIDVPAVGTRYVQVYRLRFIDAASVGNLIVRSFPNAQVTVDADLNALTIRAVASDQQRIAEAITQLDAPPGAASNPAGGPTIQQPGAVANTVGPGGQTIEVISLKAAAPGINGAPSTSATDIATTVTTALQQTAPDLKITVPPNSTQLVLTGSPYSIKLARDLIIQLDVAQKLVVLDTEILEVDETVAKTLGIQLSPLISTTYGELTPVAPPGGGTPPPLLGIQPFNRTPLSFTATLNLAIQHGTARVLADPRITTISGRTATIRAGDNISILTTTGGGTGTVATTQLQTFQTGVTLDITPVINSGNFITVALHPSVNSLSGIINGVPQISTRETQTTVGMQEDQTLVIGGLIEDNTSRNENRIPVLGDLPLVGRLFRNQSLNHTRNELIITVTPHIVYPGTPILLPGPPLPVIPSPAALPTLPPGAQLPLTGQGSSPVFPVGQSPSPTPLPSATAAATPGTSTFVSVSTQPTPSAFSQANTFVYGKVPSNTYAGQNDPVQIFYATFGPTVLKNNDPVQVSAITTINVNRLTISYPGLVTQLAQIAAGQWQATYNFTTAALPAGQSNVRLTLTAFGSVGQSASIQIPVSISP